MTNVFSGGSSGRYPMPSENHDYPRPSGYPKPSDNHDYPRPSEYQKPSENHDYPRPSEGCSDNW